MWSATPPRIAHRRVGLNQSQKARANSIKRAPWVSALITERILRQPFQVEHAELPQEENVMHRPCH